SHTAFVASLATVIGLRDGFNSSAFAVALILLVVVIRDAVGFRREIGRNATLTNKIGKEVFKNKSIKYLNEQMGHTVPQVSAGLIVGVITTVVIYVLIKNYFPL
ncbi:MAG: divergent PAP2 family protein, partial [bacterium]